MTQSKLSIKVTHIGLDYGTVTVTSGKEVTEYEVPLGLAEALQERARRIQEAMNPGSVEQRIADGLAQ